MKTFWSRDWNSKLPTIIHSSTIWRLSSIRSRYKKPSIKKTISVSVIAKFDCTYFFSSNSSIWFSSNGHGLYRSWSKCAGSFDNLHFRATFWSKKIHAFFSWFNGRFSIISDFVGPFSRWPFDWVHWHFTGLWLDSANSHCGLFNWTSNWSWMFFLAFLWWVVH